jgi:hypothetical protein
MAHSLVTVSATVSRPTKAQLYMNFPGLEWLSKVRYFVNFKGTWPPPPPPNLVPPILERHGDILVRECLLSFGAESFVFQVAIQKLKDQDI